VTAPRVSIRLATKGDARGFVEAWNDSFRAGHLKYTGTQLRGREHVHRFEALCAKAARHWFMVVAVTGDGEIAGSCTFVAPERGRTRHRGELGWMVRHDFAGRGIATNLLRVALAEARRRGFKRVEAEVAADNVASVRLAKRFGFRVEGTRRAGIVLDSGRYLDTYLFGKVLR